MSRVALPRTCLSPSRNAARFGIKLTALPGVRHHTSRVGPSDFSRLKINPTRLMDTLHMTCQWGQGHRYGPGATQTGMSRLTLDEEDKKVRDWLAEEVKALGCELTVDEMGNMFAVRPGRAADKPPIMMGSHYDTQPTGGRYDGILGMSAALEVLRTLHENGYQTENPVGLINWTNEEGARFPMTTMGSSVWAGTVPLSTAHATAEVPSLSSSSSSSLRTVEQELKAIGYLGTTPASHTTNPIAAHFELHIEQGPILENARQSIGVVTGGQAYSWFEITVTGQDSHAGTTPLESRSDPLIVAARMIASARSFAKGKGGLATVGIVSASPGSVNTIPRSVTFTLDVRHPEQERVKKIVQLFKNHWKRQIMYFRKKGMRLGMTWKTFMECPAVKFDEGCIRAVEEAAKAAVASMPRHQLEREKQEEEEEEEEERRQQQLDEQAQSQPQQLWRRMLSGAGHDSCQTSKRVPTAMIFTPTRNGMSHTPDEYCSRYYCALGAQTLLGAVLRYDARRGESDAESNARVEELKRDEESERAEVVQGEDLKSPQDENLKDV